MLNIETCLDICRMGSNSQIGLGIDLIWDDSQTGSDIHKLYEFGTVVFNTPKRDLKVNRPTHFDRL